MHFKQRASSTVCLNWTAYVTGISKGLDHRQHPLTHTHTHTNTHKSASQAFSKVWTTGSTHSLTHTHKHKPVSQAFSKVWTIGSTHSLTHTHTYTHTCTFLVRVPCMPTARVPHPGLDHRQHSHTHTQTHTCTFLVRVPCTPTARVPHPGLDHRQHSHTHTHTHTNTHLHIFGTCPLHAHRTCATPRSGPPAAPHTPRPPPRYRSCCCY